MRYVIQMGRIYRLTDGMYRKLLKDGMENGVVEDFSKYKASDISKAINITDWSKDDFETELDKERHASPTIRNKTKE